MINLVWNTTGYLWNGAVFPGNPDENSRNIEDVVRIAVTSPDEMASDTDRVTRLFQQSKDYPPLFKKAFGTDVITFKNIERAIAQFVRTLVSADSKFDRYLKGEVDLSDEEKGWVCPLYDGTGWRLFSLPWR